MQMPSNCHNQTRAATAALYTVRNRRGAAYLLACVTLVVGLTLALALLRMVGGGMRTEMSRSGKAAAADMAEAGTAYAAWRTTQGGIVLPYTQDVTLSSGSFHIDMVDDSARSWNAILVTSTGSCKDQQYEIKRVVYSHGQPLPYDYALCVNSAINVGKQVLCCTTQGGIRSNGSISLTGAGNNITMGVWANGSISGLGTITPVYPNYSQITFPYVDLAHYQSIATQVWNANMTYSGFDAPSPQIIYVHGTVKLNAGTYNGLTTIVCDNTVSVSGAFRKANSASYLAIITTKGLNISENLDAVTYCHSSIGTAKTTLMVSGITINGSTCSDVFQLNGQPNTFNQDPGLTRSVMAQLNLPGL